MGKGDKQWNGSVMDDIQVVDTGNRSCSYVSVNPGVLAGLSEIVGKKTKGMK